jgi:hypothetical protein
MSMSVTISSAELKRRGIAALEEGLAQGPVEIRKHNRLAAIVLSPTDYQRLRHDSPKPEAPGMSALQWLELQESSASNTKAEIDAMLAIERNW